MTNQTQIELNVPGIISKYHLSDKINIYKQILVKENQRINLVSRETIDTGFEDLCAESVLPLDYLIDSVYDNYLDIGTGGGMPSIPIILSEKVINTFLVERRQKKASAIRRILLGLSKNAEIYPDSFENINFKIQFDLVTLRLVKLTPQLLLKIMTLLSKTGYFIYYSKPEFDVDNSSFFCLTHYYTMQNENTPKSFTIFKNL